MLESGMDEQERKDMPPIDENRIDDIENVIIGRMTARHAADQVGILNERLKHMLENLDRAEKTVSAQAERITKQDERIAKMERTFNMGAGVLLVVPIVGAFVAWLIAGGTKFFTPWK